MRIFRTARFSAALIAGAIVAVGCDKTLTVEPSNEVEASQAIVDATSARAALAGAYDALQDGSYYGGTFLFFTELPTDNADHVGTFTNFGDMDANQESADNDDILSVWNDIYIAIGRDNTLIKKIPAVSALSDDEKSDIVGQAYLLRALNYHNLVKLWGAVPITLEPTTDVGQVADLSRSPVTDVYQRILKDLDSASVFISNSSTTRKGTPGAVEALRSRVLLYMKDWQGTIAAADNVIAGGYQLAPTFASLFSAEGSDTPEDVWRLSFTATEYNLLGYYYISKSYGGRRELAPTDDLAAAFDPPDMRGTWSISYDSRDRIYGSKFPTTVGAEDLHLIRFAEVLLNKAEAQAMLGDLQGAVATYNPIRVRAGLAPHVLGTDVTTQQEVLDAIWSERRKELAFEGDRWPDLVRTGRAVSLLDIPEYRTLWPIPTHEIDVAPKLTQNPGY